MNKPQRFYALMCVLGTALPWYFFGVYFWQSPVSLTGLLADTVSNPWQAGLLSDLLVSAVVFLVWSFIDAARARTKDGWLVLAAMCLVGMSLAMPLYLWRRENRQAR